MNSSRCAQRAIRENDLPVHPPDDGAEHNGTIHGEVTVGSSVSKADNSEDQTYKVTLISLEGRSEYCFAQ